MAIARRLAAGVSRRHNERLQRRQQMAFYRTFVSEGSLVFDVGANVGQRTAVFRALGAKVVAYEPMPSLADGLRRRFADVEVRAVALGADSGTGTLHVADVSTISSMSSEWLAAVQRSGRFSDHTWDRTVEVPVSTLDGEIERFGRPEFCKIDVEGFESDVLRGLSIPIRAVSIEFTAEHRNSGDACLQRLAELGDYEFSFSAGESMQLWDHGWVDYPTAVARLHALPDKLAWGDTYARLLD